MHSVNASIGNLLLVVAALLTSSCAHTNRSTAQESHRWLFTAADLALLEAQHARPNLERQVGLDGREVIELDADDYFDDRGMRLAIEKMPNLQILSLLSCSRVTDKGLRQIASLPHLKTLSLDRTAITDRGIRHILPLKHLEWLNVSGTAVTASGLATLVQLSKLPAIDATEIAFTAAEKEMLRRVLGKAITFD